MESRILTTYNALPSEGSNGERERLHLDAIAHPIIRPTKLTQMLRKADIQMPLLFSVFAPVSVLQRAFFPGGLPLFCAHVA